MENAVLKCLKERRSIRSFKETPIERDVLEAILEAGTYAASGMGRQSPIMLVINDAETREKLRKLNASVMGRDDIDPFYGAPTVVAVLADKNILTCVEDGSLVIGNLMNAAHSLGVDSCWIHRAREEFEMLEGRELLRKLGISDDYIGVGHCILGYRDCEYPVPRERKADYIRFI